jgi:hypothetical protein
METKTAEKVKNVMKMVVKPAKTLDKRSSCSSRKALLTLMQSRAILPMNQNQAESVIASYRPGLS